MQGRWSSKRPERLRGLSDLMPGQINPYQTNNQRIWSRYRKPLGGLHVSTVTLAHSTKRALNSVNQPTQDGVPTIITLNSGQPRSRPPPWRAGSEQPRHERVYRVMIWPLFWRIRHRPRPSPGHRMRPIDATNQVSLQSTEPQPWRPRLPAASSAALAAATPTCEDWYSSSPTWGMQERASWKRSASTRNLPTSGA